MMSAVRHDSPNPKPPQQRRQRRRAPAWITDELVADTISTWQPYYDDPLTEQDAIEMLVNVGRFFDLLEADHDHPRHRQKTPGELPRPRDGR